MNVQTAVRTARKTLANWIAPPSRLQDSVQVRVGAQLDLTEKSFQGSCLPVMPGQVRIYKSFKPKKVVLTELVVATFTCAGKPDVERAVCVEKAADLMIVSAFIGPDNCFTSAPGPGIGIAGPTFADSEAIVWPVFRALNDLTIGFEVEQTALYRVAFRCGTCGHEDAHFKDYGAPSKVQVRANMYFIGEAVS